MTSAINYAIIHDNYLINIHNPKNFSREYLGLTTVQTVATALPIHRCERTSSRFAIGYVRNTAGSLIPILYLIILLS